MSQPAMLIRRSPKGPPCSVGLLLNLMPQDEADTLEDWLRSPMEATEIAERVLQEGYADIAGGTYARHRRGACLCGRLKA